MGGNKGFNKWIGPLISPFEGQVERSLWVDVSILLYQWNRRNSILAERLFSITGDDPPPQVILTSLVDFILAQVGIFTQDFQRVTLVVEGHTPKPRYLPRDSKRGRALNQAIRAKFSSRRRIARGRAQRLIARWMGRPLQWFNHLLVERLRTLGQTVGWIVVHCADGCQANDLIIQQATLGDSVLSSDRDFLALCRENSIGQIVYMDTLSRSPKSVSVEGVLNESNLTRRELQVAYILSGCDDASVKLSGYGWKSALNMLRRYGETDSYRRLRQRFEDQQVPEDQPIALLEIDIANLTGQRGTFIFMSKILLLIINMK